MNWAMEKDGPCCNDCNDTKVIPARLVNMGVPLKTADEIGQATGEFGMGKTPPGWESTDG